VPIDDPHDIVIVGAGAAGLATAIFAGRLTRRRVLLVDGAARPGAKILISGGSRCNVTNAVVTERDYWGGRRTIISRVLAKLTVAQTIDFFAEIGVALKEEPGTKLFPRSDRSRDVLDALLSAARGANVTLATATRVHDVVAQEANGFLLGTSAGPLRARTLVMATGGLSLPKTGSDGAGLRIARALGHSIVATTPALAPLVVTQGFNESVSGVAHEVELSLHVDGRVTERIRRSMLWTHFGVSGPAALDVSRHLLRARLEARSTALTVSLLPGATFESLEERWTHLASTRPRLTLNGALSEMLPGSVASALLNHIQVDPEVKLASLTRSTRRTVSHALTGLPLNVADSRGYNYAEATAGGVALDEINPGSMESRRCSGLYFVGEMLDVDGRLGGFNFQWAWSSGRAAAEGLARRIGTL
jgi:predicted Rossmann fold flavoprotein